MKLAQLDAQFGPGKGIGGDQGDGEEWDVSVAAEMGVRVLCDLYPEGTFVDFETLRGRRPCTPLDVFIYHRL